MDGWVDAELVVKKSLLPLLFLVSKRPRSKFRHAAAYHHCGNAYGMVVREVTDLEEGRKESSFRTFSTCVSGYMLSLLLNPPSRFLGNNNNITDVLCGMIQ